MSDFELFEKALSEYTTQTINEPEIIQLCTHSNTSSDEGVIKCVNCGEEMDKDIVYDKEWMWYGKAGNRLSDPSRVQQRKIGTRTIYDDVKNMKFPEKIVDIANTLYTKVTNKEIYRGTFRKAIIFACIFHGHKMAGVPQSHDNLIKVFGLARKSGLKGLKFVSMRSLEVRSSCITPISLIEEIMNRFNATESQKEEVINLYDKIKNRSSKLNRSRPQSIAAGLTFYWICSNNKNIAIKEFVSQVELSELTVQKITKEIANILGTINNIQV